MEKPEKRKWFSGFNAGMLAMFALLVLVGLIVWTSISVFGGEQFDAALDSATPYLAGVRGLIYCLVLAGWKRVCGYLAEGNSEIYEALLKRRFHLLGLIIVVELLLINKLFIF